MFSEATTTVLESLVHKFHRKTGIIEQCTYPHRPVPTQNIFRATTTDAQNNATTNPLLTLTRPK